MEFDHDEGRFAVVDRHPIADHSADLLLHVLAALSRIGTETSSGAMALLRV
ncbi:hypothetical protein [Methylobacterium sp. WL19]|uniref:hypothetical protein n=1 Tax=Methylobacterium sp. WL19 TaxID=2603896 RepID=UPI001650AF6F|nr:hypothetical protein [Methylobacterium sp. WL19]